MYQLQFNSTTKVWARARQFFSSGLGFGLETQKPGLGLRTRTRNLLDSDSDSSPTHLDSDSDSRHADSDSTRTRRNEDSLHLCIYICGDFALPCFFLLMIFCDTWVWNCCINRDVAYVMMEVIYNFVAHIIFLSVARIKIPTMNRCRRAYHIFNLE